MGSAIDAICLTARWRENLNCRFEKRDGARAERAASR
jgi:hypothetical protein